MESLFDDKTDWTQLSHTNDPDTSKAAAAEQAEKLSKLQEIVLSIFEKGWDFTDTQLCDYYAAWGEYHGWPNVTRETPRKRRSDLTRLGKLVDSGERRENNHGRNEVVWILAPQSSDS